MSLPWCNMTSNQVSYKHSPVSTSPCGVVGDCGRVGFDAVSHIPSIWHTCSGHPDGRFAPTSLHVGPPSPLASLSLRTQDDMMTPSDSAGAAAHHSSALPSRRLATLDQSPLLRLPSVPSRRCRSRPRTSSLPRQRSRGVRRPNPAPPLLCPSPPPLEQAPGASSTTSSSTSPAGQQTPPPVLPPSATRSTTTTSPRPTSSLSASTRTQSCASAQ